MSRQQTSIKHSALGWVKKSIDDNLAEINVDLKLYIEDADDSLLEKIKERLSVIEGVLMMIEQYGAAMLTEEMVSLCDYIIENKPAQGDHSLEVMLRAVLHLPDYLEHIQSGHRDIPIAILPLLNDLRAVKNQDLFSEKLLFLPDLSMHQGDVDSDAIDPGSNQASKQIAKKLRPIYQFALLNVIKENEVEGNLRRLEKVCETFEEKSYSEQAARIWWIIGALVESVSRQQLELGASIKNLLGKVDALFRVILLIGEQGLLKRQPIDLIKNFLFYIAQPECDGPKAQAIKIAYRLEQFLPSEAVRSRVLDNIAGPNQALLKTVSEAMKADIEAVKSTLEVYVNGDLGDTDQLKELPQDLHVISDTLAMIGLGQQRQMIESQIVIIKEVVSGNQLSSEEELLSMASELIQVEHALDAMQKRSLNPDPEDDRSDSTVSRDYELDNVISAVVTAALDDIQKTKSAILDFIKDPTRGENIDLCIELMDESRGALELLNKPRAVAVVDGLLKYLNDHDIAEFMDSDRLDALSQVVVSLEYYLEALGEHRSDADNILDFADTQLQELLKSAEQRSLIEPEDESELVIVDDIAAIDIDGQPSLSTDEAIEDENVEIEVLDTDLEENPPTQEHLEDENIDLEAPLEPVIAAEYSFEPEADEHIVNEISDELEDLHAVLDVDEPVQSVDPVGESFETDEEESDIRLESPENVESTEVFEAVEIGQAEATIDVQPVVEDLIVLKPGSDPEILEIYLEEAEEESENIARLQQDWLLHPEDQNALKNIRRAFHTIKGSGRLVGAMKIGEFAWDYEQLLNCVIDKTIAPSDAIIDAVGQAAVASMELVNELKTLEPPTSDIAYLRGLARALSTFDADQVLIERTGVMQIIESPYDRITDLTDDALDPASLVDDEVADLEPLSETVVIPHHLEISEDHAVEIEAMQDVVVNEVDFDDGIMEETLVVPVSAKDYAADTAKAVEINLDSDSEADLEGFSRSESEPGVNFDSDFNIDFAVDLEDTQALDANDVSLEFEVLTSPDNALVEEPEEISIEAPDSSEESDMLEVDSLDDDFEQLVGQEPESEPEIPDATGETPPDPFVETTSNVMPGGG